MDRFSFLNAAHTEFFAQLYDQYLDNPDSVEPSWRSFFQGFDFGMESFGGEAPAQSVASPSAGTADYDQISEKLHKEFNVLKLIEGYRPVGICLQKQTPLETEGFLSLPSISVILDFHLRI
jgi:2-oxoglutarate dehydrogenase E1 component